jgi:hypothetical protein
MSYVVCAVQRLGMSGRSRGNAAVRPDLAVGRSLLARSGITGYGTRFRHRAGRTSLRHLGAAEVRAPRAAHAPARAHLGANRATGRVARRMRLRGRPPETGHSRGGSLDPPPEAESLPTPVADVEVGTQTPREAPDRYPPRGCAGPGTTRGGRPQRDRWPGQHPTGRRATSGCRGGYGVARTLVTEVMLEIRPGSTNSTTVASISTSTMLARLKLGCTAGAPSGASFIHMSQTTRR